MLTWIALVLHHSSEPMTSCLASASIIGVLAAAVADGQALSATSFCLAGGHRDPWFFRDRSRSGRGQAPSCGPTGIRAVPDSSGVSRSLLRRTADLLVIVEFASLLSWAVCWLGMLGTCQRDRVDRSTGSWISNRDGIVLKAPGSRVGFPSRSLNSTPNPAELDASSSATASLKDTISPGSIWKAAAVAL